MSSLGTTNAWTVRTSASAPSFAPGTTTPAPPVTKKEAEEEEKKVVFDYFDD